MDEHRISILLATFNGERYIAEQLDSLFKQTVQDFDLYVTDDCSSDNTVSILRKYEYKYKDRMFVSVNAVNSGSAKANFLSMMVAYKNDYIMLCDQDDVWLPNKIDIEMRAMREVEEKYGKSTPLLVHTDLRVVDADICVIGESLNKMLGLHMELSVLPSQIVQNTVTGCTVMYNRALAELIRPSPYAIMHDWWLGMIAAAFGRKVYIPEATVLYRQHRDNTVGAKDVRSMGYLINRINHLEDIRSSLENTYRQSGAFAKVYGDVLNKDDLCFLLDYAAVSSYPKLKRWSEVNRLRTVKHGLLRRIGQLLYI